MRQPGSINACGKLALYDANNNIVGYCLDTPNAFAKKCVENPNIVKGVAHYQYFAPEIRLRDDEDNIDRMRMYK